MLKDRINTVTDVTQKLHRFENTIDASIISGSDLFRGLCAGRSKARLSAIVGQDAIALTLESLQTLVDAREKIVEAHKALDTIRSELDLPTYMSGDLWKQPSVSASDDDADVEAENVVQIA